MNLPSWFRPVIYAVSIGLFIIGTLTTGFAAYGEIQSTPYMVQVDQVGSSISKSTVAYSSLTSAEKAIFDRVKTGGAAPVGKTSLSTFANNAVQYQGEVYTFEMTYDPATLTLLPFGFGISLSVAGGTLFFLTSFIIRHRTSTSNSHIRE